MILIPKQVFFSLFIVAKMFTILYILSLSMNGWIVMAILLLV